MPTIKELVEKSLNVPAFNEEISILIFGPGKPKGDPTTSKCWMKRNKIKDFLNEKFPKSKNSGIIEFPEELVKKIKKQGQSDLDAETHIAYAVDLIIVLDCSTNGVTLEIGKFSSHSWFRDKSYIFLPKKYLKTKSLAKDIHSEYVSSHIVGFTDEEFELCNLVTKKILRIAQDRAISKIINRK